MTAVSALQDVLAAEHAAMFVLSTLGGVTSRSARPSIQTALVEAFDQHRDRRDQLSARIIELDGQPVAAAASYEVPPLDDVPAAALEVERACAAAYASAVAETSGTDRTWATAALGECALRELSFGAAPTAFPGLDELR